MRQLGILLMVGCLPVTAIAGTAAIEATNYKLGAGYSTVDNLGPATQSSYAVSAQSRFGIDDNTGMSLSTSFSKIYLKNDSLQAEPSFLSVGAGFFVRDYEVGSLNMGFSYTRGQSYSTLDGYTDNITQSVSLSGTYYLSQFDLSTGVSQAGYSNTLTDSSKSSHIGAGYYINDNLRLSANVYGLDSSGSRSLGVTFQPAVMSNQWSVSGGFFSNTNNVDTYSLSLDYHFDTKVSLFERNRKY